MRTVLSHQLISRGTPGFLGQASLDDAISCREKITYQTAVSQLPARASTARSSWVASLAQAHGSSSPLSSSDVAAQAPGTLSDTVAELRLALSELPNGLGPEIEALMAELGMTQSTTHYRPFFDLATGEKINGSIALIR